MGVEIFTVTGRLIRTISGLTGRAGYNENPGAWNGLDQDGDRIAYGTYLYRLTARRSGETATAIGKAVIVPPPLPEPTTSFE